MDYRKEVLEKIAHEYHTNNEIPDIHIENSCQQYFIEWLLKRIAKHEKVLELGYGDGLVTAALYQHGCDLTVIEGAKSLVDVALAKHSDLNCVDTLFEDYRPVQKFDVIIASHVLEHVDNPQEILALMTSWLSSHGKIIIVVPNRNSIHRQLAVTMGLQPELDTLSSRDILVGHQRVYSFDTLRQDIEAANLVASEETGFFLKVLPNSMMLSYQVALINALNHISPQIPKELLANIAMIVQRTGI